MSAASKATEVDRNVADKEKSANDKTESLKRSASELNDAGDEAKQKIRKTDKAANENGESEHKEEDDVDDDDSKDEDEEVGPEGDGDDFDEEEGDDDGAEEDDEDEDA